MVKYYEKSPLSFELGKPIFPEKFDDFTSKLTIQFRNSINEIIWQINEAKSWILDEKGMMEKLKKQVENAENLSQIEDIITIISDRKESLKILDELREILDSKFQEMILPMQEIVDEINQMVSSNVDGLCVEYHNHKKYKIIRAEVIQIKTNDNLRANIRLNLEDKNGKLVHWDCRRDNSTSLKLVSLK